MTRKRASILCGSISVLVAILFLNLFYTPELLAAVVLILAAGMVGAFIGWFGERIGIMARSNPVMRIIKSTLVFGIIFFIPGYIGPMLFWPGASQGPLLGIFVTGPLGVLTGFTVGLVFVIYDLVNKRTNLEK